MGVEDDVLKDLIDKYSSSKKDVPACFLDAKNLPEHKLGFLSTGSYMLDNALGGGVPYGRMIEIYGWEAAGKSFLAGNLLANCQKSKGISVLLDTEYSLLPQWAKCLGINDSKLIIIQPDHLQDAFEKIVTISEFIAKKNVPCCIVVDSVSATPAKEEVEAEAFDKSIALGVHAKVLSLALRKLSKIMWDRKIALVFISQLREKIGMTWGGGTTSIGGKAIRFHAAVRIEMQKKGLLYTDSTAKDDPIGVNCKVTIAKNKIAIPYKSAEMDILFNEGLDIGKDGLLWAIKLGIVKFHKMGWYEYKDKKYRAKDFKKDFEKQILDGSLFKNPPKEEIPKKKEDGIDL